MTGNVGNERDDGTEFTETRRERRHQSGENSWSGERNVEAEQAVESPGAQSLGRFGKAAILPFQRQANGAHLKRKGQDRRRQSRARPAEYETDTEIREQEGAQWRTRTERNQQQIAERNRRKHQRQMDQPIDQRLAAKPAPRQQQSGEESEGQIR